MEHISKPSIKRLSKRAGVKSMSDDSYEVVNKIIEQNLEEIINVVLVINSQNKNKIITKEDLYNALNLKGCNVSYSNELGINTFIK
jgi:histone H3/H4